MVEHSIWSKTLRATRGLMLRHMPMMITCREFEDFVLAYFDGDLPSRQRFIFELHLKVCPECRAYLRAYKRAVEVAKRVFDDDDVPVPLDVPEDLVTAILAARDA